jgi:hypothetical protein
VPFFFFFCDLLSKASINKTNTPLSYPLIDPSHVLFSTPSTPSSSLITSGAPLHGFQALQPPQNPSSERNSTPSVPFERANLSSLSLSSHPSTPGGEALRSPFVTLSEISSEGGDPEMFSALSNMSASVHEDGHGRDGSVSEMSWTSVRGMGQRSS